MPYSSDRQRRYFHYAESVGKISPKVVAEFDSASRGMSLPDHSAMASALKKRRKKKKKEI